MIYLKNPVRHSLVLLTIVFVALVFSAKVMAQTPAAKPQPAAPAPAGSAATPAAPASPVLTPAAAAAAKATADYERLLQEYYHTQPVSENGFIKGTVKYFLRESKKTGPEYSVMDTPEFLAEAKAAVENRWKSIIRKKLTAQELQYLVLFEKSALRKKLVEVEAEMVKIDDLGPLFMQSFQKIKSKAPPAKR
jgi:hypothetical protein